MPRACEAVATRTEPLSDGPRQDAERGHSCRTTAAAPACCARAGAQPPRTRIELREQSTQGSLSQARHSSGAATLKLERGMPLRAQSTGSPAI